MDVLKDNSDVVAPSVDESLRFITDAAAARAQLAISSIELDRKSAQLEALSKLVSYLKLYSTLFSVAVSTSPLDAIAASPQHSHTTALDALREALSLRSAEVTFWRESYQQLAAALVLAEEEVHTQAAAKTVCEEQMSSAMTAAENRYSALQEQAGDLIAQTEELARIIEEKNQELLVAGRTHSEYVHSTTKLLEQQELAMADLQRQSMHFSNIQNSSNGGVAIQQGSSSTPHPSSGISNESDTGLLHNMRLQIQELEGQLSLQTRATRTNLNPSYQPSSSTSPALRISASDYVPPPLPPSELLDEVGFSSTNAGSMISLASSDPTSLVATVSSSLDELGRFVTPVSVALTSSTNRHTFVFLRRNSFA